MIAPFMRRPRFLMAFGVIAGLAFVTVRAGWTMVFSQSALAQPAGVISGRVLHADGASAVGVSIAATVSSIAGRNSLDSEQVSAFARADRDGRFRLENLSSGSYLLAVGAVRDTGSARAPASALENAVYFSNGSGAVSVNVRSGAVTEVEFVLPAEPAPLFPGLRVSGVVAGALRSAIPASGALRLAPAPTVLFYRGLECGFNPAFSADIAPDGAYEIRHVPSGVYSACLPNPTGNEGHFGPLDFLFAGEDVRADLDFEEGPRSRGRTVSRPLWIGAGVKGSAALTGPEAGKTVMGRVIRAVRDGVDGEPWPTSSDRRQLPPGVATTAVIYLVPAGEKGVPMRPLVALPTSLESPAGGEFTIDNVPPGRYNLFATVPDSGSRLRGETGLVSVGRLPISIEGWELATLSIVAHRGVSVSGRVVRNGLPLSAGVALALEPDMDVAGILAYQDIARPVIAPASGVFEFGQVPEGRYRLRAAVAGQPESVVRIFLNGKDVTDSGFDIADSAPAPLEVVVQH